MNTASDGPAGPPSAAGLAALAPIVTVPTAGLIAEQLRGHILSGAFPPGSQLVEIQLAQRLGVSRGPVREALQRLIQQGLLVNVRNRGVFVIDLGSADVADIYLARRSVERQAAMQLCRDRAAGVPIRSTLERLDAVVDRMAEFALAGDWTGLAESDLEFHATLVAGAGSPRLNRMFATLAAETRLCLENLRHVYPRHADVADEHRRLIVLLREAGESRVLAAVEEHLTPSAAALARPEPVAVRQPAC